MGINPRQHIRKVMESSNGGDTDRISMLPDDLICKILSILPTKYAVGTSVLSKRWQDMWASVPTLNFDDSLYFNKTIARGLSKTKMDVDSKFMSFVESVLIGSQVSCFESFCFERHYVDDEFRVNSWISFVLEHNVRKMELRYYASLPIILPSNLFESKTLVVLILKWAVLLEVPAFVWLPSLKVLHLDSIMKCSDEDSDQKLLLFSGCPVLEELYIERWTFDDRCSLVVSIPTLKRLRLGFEMDHFVTYSSYELEIDAPKLEHLDLEDFATDEIYVNLSSVLEARISVGSCILRRLLEGIRTVKFLSISDSTLGYISEEKFYWLPTFHNLIVLEIGANGDLGWNVLAGFLELSPNLEVLKLLKGPYYGVSEDSWVGPPPSKVSNLLLHLKETKIDEFNGRKYEIEAIEFILKNAKVLKTMTIDCRSRKINKGIREKLAGFPRASKNSQLNLLF